MKKVLAACLALMATLNPALAQRVPDSSVTGVARASVGIEPITNLPTQPSTGDSALASAYEPSWTMLVGDATQTKLPRKISFYWSGSLVAVAVINTDGTVKGWRPDIYYCFEGYCGYASGTGGWLSGSYATGSRAVVLQWRSWNTTRTTTFNPIITAKGELSGWSVHVNDDNAVQASYNNVAGTTFVGPQAATNAYCYHTLGSSAGNAACTAWTTAKWETN
jgi:hypothetical protein